MAVCTSCGRIFSDDAPSCPACGATGATTASLLQNNRPMLSAVVRAADPRAGGSGYALDLGSSPRRAEIQAARRRTTLEARRRTWSWESRIQWVIAALAVVTLAALTYTSAGWIPLISNVDLAIHDFGRAISAPAPEIVANATGSFLQVAVPLIFALIFFWRRERFAALLMLAWAGESLNYVSVYAGDARTMALPAFLNDSSGAPHEWHVLLSRLDALPHTEMIAYGLRGASAALFALALGLSVRSFMKARRAG